jgi:hypothetical protein
MKRIYMTVALLGALVTGAFAQKTIDLSLETFFPGNPSTQQNLVAGDSFPIAVIVKNNGTGAVDPTDTIKFSFGGFAHDNSYYYNVPVRYYGFTIANGGQDTIVRYFTQGETLGTGQDGSVIVDFPTSVVDSNLYVFVNGTDATGTPFTDAGFYPGGSSDGSDSVDFSGNNVTPLWVVTWAAPVTAINNVNLTKTSLTVYPNPTTQGQVTVRNEFKAASKTASLTVSDISGRIVKIITLGQQTSGVKNFNVDVTDLNSGSYYIQLVTDQTRGVAKFTKN